MHTFLFHYIITTIGVIGPVIIKGNGDLSCDTYYENGDLSCDTYHEKV